MKRQAVKIATHLLFGVPAYLALASIMAPLLEVRGWIRVANRLYLLLSYFCHQITLAQPLGFWSAHGVVQP